MSTLSPRVFVCAVCACLVLQAGCTRSRYRLRADRDAYCILHEKTDSTPWRPPINYSVYPVPASRWYDPTPADDPRLPIPSPQLYAYPLPEMPQRDPARFQPSLNLQRETAALTNGASSLAGAMQRLPSVISATANPTNGPLDDGQPHVLAAAYSGSETAPKTYDGLLASVTDPIPQPMSGDSAVIAADVESNDGIVDPAQPVADANANEETGTDVLEEELETEVGLKRVPIPARYWDSIPSNCLRRMLEFDSVRNEFRDTFRRAPEPAQLDSAPRLALEDIIDQASLNSRELQAQKELLYRVALALTLDRFEYQLKPSVGGNNTAANYSHNRSGGVTVNTLGIPTNFQIDKMLCTGGDFLARFANNVILTFNGPQGFAADVGSELLFDFSQSLLQRDIRLEGLTQAERDVVYAAREFARFRRELFVTIASQYYDLIRQFREVEIGSQNYFTLVRQFNQGEAEFRAGLVDRFQLDQVEQRVIDGRRGLLEICTGLDNALDDLKIRIGLPTEEPLNINLTELFLLTLRDELAVNGELIERVRNRLNAERRQEFPARATLLSAGSVLVDRMRDSNELRNRLGEETPLSDELVDLGLRMQTEAARLDVDDALLELQSELDAETQSQPIVFQRRMDVVNEQLEVIQIQLERAGRQYPPDRLTTSKMQAEQYGRRAGQLADRFDQLIADERLAELPRVLEDSVQLANDIAALVQQLDSILGRDTRQRTPEEKLQETITEVDELLRESESYLLSAQGGLVPIEIDMDDAMMTALVRRFDLLNERGFLADDWRQIKLAADDLKSVLNLRAAQSIRTRNGVNRPFDFTFDDSTTSLSATFDAPFNRRAQRNTFRNTLIDYQAALRRLALLEDSIKLSVRRDLRSLALGRERYVIDIASAALAFERVVSTELELRLGIGGVQARDFLDAQTAYTASLTGVAARHIGYIVDRLQLFLDLELLAVDDDGFWQQLYDEDIQPMPYYQFPRYALPAYGTLTPCLKYSPEIRRMLCVPPGTAVIHKDEISDEAPRELSTEASNLDEPQALPSSPD